MTERIERAGLQVARELATFVSEQVLPGTGVEEMTFWTGFASIVHDLSPRNRELLARRDDLQEKLDAWYRENGPPSDMEVYKQFLRDIGYLLEEGAPFSISTRGGTASSGLSTPSRSSACSASQVLRRSLTCWV